MESTSRIEDAAMAFALVVRQRDRHAWHLSGRLRSGAQDDRLETCSKRRLTRRKSMRSCR